MRIAAPVDAVLVAVDPGKAQHRVWVANQSEGLLEEPLSVPALRDGVEALASLVAKHANGAAPLIAVEATGALHQPFARELERRFPGSLRLFAPSETQAARTQLGSRRFKTDDRDCAALIYLLRQGEGRPAEDPALDALTAAVRHRRGLVAQRKVLQQRMHDQLNALCPGLSAPAGHGRALALEDSSGQAVLACAVAFAGRPPSWRSLVARAPGRLYESNARFWSERWRRLLPPPADAAARAQRLAGELGRWQLLQSDIHAVETEIAELLAATDGQVLTSLPGVATVRAAAFACHSLPLERFATAERLYSATGLAPANYQSSTITRRGRISRQGLAEHRDALMGIAWGLSQFSQTFRERDQELRARGFQPIQARVALARNACRLCFRLIETQQPFDEERYRRARHSRGR
ncbi:MAG TPA: IS110 family transposase [Thermoleophilaceae bacterium]